MTQEEIEAIVLAEYNYWNKVDDVIAIAAVGACANIYAALKGFPAPWHKEYQRKPNDETGIEATRLSQNPNA